MSRSLPTPIFFTLISLFAAFITGQVVDNTQGPGYHVLSNGGSVPDFLRVRRSFSTKRYADVFLCDSNFLQGDCHVVALEWGQEGCLTLDPEMQNRITSWRFPLRVTNTGEQCQTFGQEECEGYTRNIAPGDDNGLELGDPVGTFVSFKCWYR